MELISGSLFCRFLLGAWAILCRFSTRVWEGFWALCGESAVGRGLAYLCGVWKNWWHGSVLVGFFLEREGVLSRSWAGSLTCRGLNWLINLPANLLHWLYKKWQDIFEDSFFARLAFEMGDSVPVAVGWFMLLIMNIPYERWSNSYSLLGYILLFMLTVAGGMRRSDLRVDTAPMGPYVIGFFLAVCLSLPLSLYPGLSFRYLVFHISCILCLCVVVGTVERSDQLERLAAFGCLGMTGTAVYAVWQRIQGVEIKAAYVDMTLNAGMPGRVYSFYSNPNSYGAFLLVLIPISMALLFGAKKARYRLVGLVSGALGTLALIMTYSRTSWVGLAVAAAVFLFLWDRRLLPVCLVVAVAAIPVLPDTIINRIRTIFNPNDTSTSSRFPLFRAALDTIRAHPAAGAGLGGDAVRQVVKDLNVYHEYAPFTHSHNIYLQLWLEHGFLGVAAFAAGMLHLLKKGAHGVVSKEGDRSARMLAIGGVSSVAGALVYGLADYMFNFPRVMLVFWFVVALTISAVRLSARSAERKLSEEKN